MTTNTTALTGNRLEERTHARFEMKDRPRKSAGSKVDEFENRRSKSTRTSEKINVSAFVRFESDSSGGTRQISPPVLGADV